MASPRRVPRPVVLRRLLEPQRDHALVLAQAYDRLFQADPATDPSHACYREVAHLAPLGPLVDTPVCNQTHDTEG